MSLQFGSSGVRGTFGDRITVDFAVRLGRALSVLGDTAVLGRDARTTGPALSKALAAGFLASGGSVEQLGCVPTPTTAHAAREADLGVHVTASHNPPSDNGVKVFDPDGASIAAKARERLAAAFDDPPTDVDWRDVGAAARDPRAPRRHADAILSAVGPAEVDVVLDGGNGPGGAFTADLLSRQGCTVTTINAHADGTFPGRASEPTAETLQDLAGLVRSGDADLGLAHDGDADRCVAVTAEGRVLTGDELLLLLVDRLEPSTIVVPVDATMRLEEVAPDAEIVRTRVGDTYISETLVRVGGDLGGEPSGSWIFPQVSLCPDGPHAALRLARIVEEGGDLADQVPATYPMRRTSYPCPEEAKADVMEAATEALSPLGEVTTVDGLRVDLDDRDGWALVRPSGTEPKVRLTVEAPDETVLASIHDEVADRLGRCLP